MTAKYDLLRHAAEQRLQVTCVFHGHYRELCPHVIGKGKAGEEKVLSFQFGGSGNSPLPAGGEWRCMAIAEMHDVQTREGPWHTRNKHSRPQTCVKIIDFEVDD